MWLLRLLVLGRGWGCDWSEVRVQGQEGLPVFMVQDRLAQLVLDPTNLLAHALACGLEDFGELREEASIQVGHLPRTLLNLLHAVAQTGEPHVEGTQVLVRHRLVSFGIKGGVVPLLLLLQVGNGAAQELDAPFTDGDGLLSTLAPQGFFRCILGDPVELLHLEPELLVRSF